MYMFLNQKVLQFYQLLSEAVIDGLTSVNASDYTDTFSCKPRVLDINGPTPLEY